MHQQQKQQLQLMHSLTDVNVGHTAHSPVGVTVGVAVGVVVGVAVGVAVHSAERHIMHKTLIKNYPKPQSCASAT